MTKLFYYLSTRFTQTDDLKLLTVFYFADVISFCHLSIPPSLFPVSLPPFLWLAPSFDVLVFVKWWLIIIWFTPRWLMTHLGGMWASEFTGSFTSIFIRTHFGLGPQKWRHSCIKRTFLNCEDISAGPRGDSFELKSDPAECCMAAKTRPVCHSLTHIWEWSVI